MLGAQGAWISPNSRSQRSGHKTWKLAHAV